MGHLLSSVPCWIKEIPNHLKTQEMCDEAVCMEPDSLAYVPDHLKTQETYKEIMRIMPDEMHFTLSLIASKQEMFIKAVEVDPWHLYGVPDHFKTQEICDKAARDCLFSLQFVPSWFKWHDGYTEWPKAQKASIKEELLHNAWHPNRVIDWCMPEDEKRWWK